MIDLALYRSTVSVVIEPVRFTRTGWQRFWRRIRVRLTVLWYPWANLKTRSICNRRWNRIAREHALEAWVKENGWCREDD